MKNPLIKRIPREFRHDLGKYLAIFLFMILFIGIVSGMLVAENSFTDVYDRSFTEKKIEDGHFSLNIEAPDTLLEEIEKEGNVTLYPYFYFEENIKDTDKNIRVYSTKRDVNLLCLMEGELPEAKDEIALDRMFADNNHIKIGDTITLKDTKLTVTGLIAASDYSSLFENGTDMMFDAINFSIAAMSEEGFQKFNTNHRIYNYAWLFPEPIEREDKALAKESCDTFIKNFENVITEYDEALVKKAYEKNPLEAESYIKKNFIEVKDFMLRYINQAINFVGDDMGSDKIMFIVFDYILTLVLAFVFAITTSNTIVAEAGVIGTLRASGYTKRELLSHYLVLPVFVTVIAAISGNVLGYTVFCDFFVDLYYANYSLAAYEELWNLEAFILTTVIPILIMLFINLFVISSKLKLSPLQFIRRDLSRNKKRKAVYLNTKIPFISRFRMRIILQNIPNYITLFFGIFIGGVLVVFGIMFGPMLNDYKKMIVDDRICDYQYILTQPIKTEDKNAEAYALTSLKTTDSKFMKEEISIFGVNENSAYLDFDVKSGEFAISNGIAEKFNLYIGDTLTLEDPYNSQKTYSFIVDTVVEYNSGLATFLPIADYREIFDKNDDFFTGYYSNTELTDIDEANVAGIITVSDLTKVSDQLTYSIVGMMDLFKWLGIIVFVLLMFIMSKQIIEKNANSISMTKILGFSNGEISGLYIVATSAVVVISLLLTIPLLDYSLKFIFESVLYTRMTGYLPCIISNTCYIEMFILGVCSYAVVAVMQMIKIRKIPKSDALKNVE